jgi:glycosyltransferase involved in cell wall biosynthesis
MKYEQPTVSVVIPTIGRPELLRAVESVANQSVSTQIIVVVDRPDAFYPVRQMLKNYDVVIERNPRKGAPAARNHGVEIATAKYVAFLDDDDYWLPSKLEIQVEKLQGHCGSAFAVTGTYVVARNGKITGRQRSIRESQPKNVGDSILQRPFVRAGNPIFCTSTLLASRILLAENAWDEELTCNQDSDLFIRMGLTPGVVIHQIQTPLAVIQQGSANSIMKNRKPDENWAFLRKHESNLSTKTKADFVLIYILLPKFGNRKWPEIFDIWRKNVGFRANLGAQLRFAVGIIIGR